MVAKRTAADVLIAAVVLYGAVWLYEAGNLLAMGVVAGDAKISIPGFLPTGVIAVSMSPLQDTMAKPLQFAIVTGVLGPTFLVAQRWRLPLMKLAATASVASYLASIYWEYLPGLVASPTTHFLVFGFTTVSLTVVATMKAGRATLSKLLPL